VIHYVANLLKRLVGAWRFELQTSCAQGSCKKSILLVRLALFYVMVRGFGPNSAVVGPKLDPSLGREKEWDSVAGCSSNQCTIWSYERFLAIIAKSSLHLSGI